MKKIGFLFSALLLGVVSCSETTVTTSEDVSYAIFGDTITADGAISADEMLAKYQKMTIGDTLEVKFKSTIYNVCQKKGCWMNVDLGEDDLAFIRFKDYGFFMPFNAAESEVIVEGIAFVDIVSVDELKHYAEDEGLDQEEIDEIDEPEITYSFLAKGVLIQE